MLGGFSEALDLIASEYGWTHDVVLDMSFGQIRQSVAAISLRRYRDRLYQESLLEWQTQTIARFIAATVPVERKGEVSPLMGEADRVSIRGTGNADTSHVQRAGREPIAGSYEAFTRGMRA